MSFSFPRAGDIDLDLVHAHFLEAGVNYGDETVSVEAFAERMGEYCEAARITESQTIILVGFGPSLNLSPAIDYLRILSDCGVTRLLMS